MRTKLNDRDYEIMDTMKQFKVMTSKCASIYFEGKNTNTVSARRLLKIYEAKPNINRYRESVTSEYIYYYNSKPTNIKHAVKVLEAYTMLKQNPNFEIIKWKIEKEFVINNKKVRADLCIIVKDKATNKLIPLIIEVDLSHRYNNKYKYLDYNSYFPCKPIIISVGRFMPTTDDVLFYKTTEIEKLKELTL